LNLLPSLESLVLRLHVCCSINIPRAKSDGHRGHTKCLSQLIRGIKFGISSLHIYCDGMPLVLFLTNPKDPWGPWLQCWLCHSANLLELLIFPGLTFLQDHVGKCTWYVLIKWSHPGWKLPLWESRTPTVMHASWISIGWILALKTDIMYVQILCNCGAFCEHGEDVGCQLIDIALRVELVRRDTVKTSQDLQVKWTCCHQMCAVQYTARYSLCSCMGGCGGCGSTLELVGTVLQPDTWLLPVGMSSPSSHCLKVFLLFATDCYHSFSIKYRMLRIWRDCNLLGEVSLTKGNKPCNRL
jgi:hypothetical protein